MIGHRFKIVLVDLNYNIFNKLAFEFCMNETADAIIETKEMFFIVVSVCFLQYFGIWLYLGTSVGWTHLDK